MKIKTTLYVLVFFACVISSNAQDISVGLPQMNVIYIGINNEVTIAVNGHATKSLVYETINCEIIEKEGKRYLRSHSRGEATLKVGVKKAGKVKWLDSFVFRVRMIPDPEPRLGTLSNGEAYNLSTISANAYKVGIGLGQGFARSNVWGTVVSYDITLIDSNIFESFSCKGEIVPLGIQSIIWRLNPGAKIILSNVYYDMQNDDTVLVRNERVEDFEYTEITVRPDQNNCSFTGGFLDTAALAIYNSARDNFYVFTGFTGKIKHGIWNYYTGYCPRWQWGQEMYDSGKLVWVKAWDSSGFMYINATKSAHNDSVFIKELYPNGQIRYEGWIVTDYENYMFRGQITPNRTDIPSVNSYMEYFSKMKFIPVGEWKAYHANGQLKYTAHFSTFTGDPYEEYYYIEEESPLPKNTVVADGIWTIYDENGIKTAEYKYDKGIIKQE